MTKQETLTSAEYRALYASPTQRRLPHVLQPLAEKTKRPKRTDLQKMIAREALRAPRSRPIVNEIVVCLPAPPSVNACWANSKTGGRRRSREYQEWHKRARKEAGTSKGRIEGPYTLTIQLGRLPVGSDVGNRAKATSDALVGVLTDDDVNCVRETSEWALDTVAPGRMRVTIARADHV